jgi:2-polyprenyl-3-methyl-5-hydroxy-6-metoxy-1,4-benzoquinol methylase
MTTTEPTTTFTYDYDAGFDDPGDKNAWFARHIGRGKRILEIGCATGYVGDHMARVLDCSVVGVEIDADAAAKARARGTYEQVLVGDVQDPALLDELDARRFDFVLFGDVLEHLQSPQRALQRTASLLDVDGRVLVCLPNVVHWSIRARVLAGRFDYTDTGILDRTHVRFYTPSSARSMVAGAGLDIRSVGGVVWLPSMLRRLPDRGRRALERVAARVAPNLVHGQILIEAAPAAAAATSSATAPEPA